MIIRPPVLAASCFALILAGASCASKNPRQGTPATVSEINAMLGAAKDPRSLFITVYRSKDGPVFADANRSHPGQLEEFDLLPAFKGAAPMFMIKDPSDQPVPVLVDFRSQQSWVDFDTAQRMRIKAIGPDPYAAYINHLDDPTEGFIGVAVNFVLSRTLQVENLIINVRPTIQSLGPQARGWSKPEPLIVLGLDTLRAFKVVQLDFPAKKIRFSVDGGYRPAAEFLLAELPARQAGTGLEVDAILDGYQGPVHLDPAAKFAVASANPARKAMRQVTLGELVLRDVAVADSDHLGLVTKGYPTIGYDLLKDLVVTLDNESGKVLVELPPPKP